MNIIKYLIIPLFIIGASEIKAETVLQLHTVSYHANRAANYNEENYGVGIRHYVKDKQYSYINAGYYENSESSNSKYIGIGWEWPVGIFRMSISAGVIDGYKLANILPYVVPIISYKNVNLIFAPYPEAVVHLTVDVLRF